MGLIKYLMGGDGRNSLKKLNKMADKVEALESKYQEMDDETLKDQTNVLKGRLAAGETAKRRTIFYTTRLRRSARRPSVFWACDTSACKLSAVSVCIKAVSRKCVRVKVKRSFPRCRRI